MSEDKNTNLTQAPASYGPSAVVIACVERLTDLERQYPEWFAEYEDAAVDTAADRAQIESLMATAPDEALRMMLFGKLVMRTQIAAITERAF